MEKEDHRGCGSIETAERRAVVYLWLASLFSREIDGRQLRAYYEEDAGEFLAALGKESPLQESVSELQLALTKLLEFEEPHLELATDFAGLFLGDAHSGAPPYASLYRSKGGLLFQEPHERMLILLKAEGYAIADGFPEPADHLALQLEYCGTMIGKSIQAIIGALADEESVSCFTRQHEFITEHLLSWIPEFTRQVWHHPTSSGFYQAASRLLLSFLRHDLDYLQGNLSGDCPR